MLETLAPWHKINTERWHHTYFVLQSITNFSQYKNNRYSFRRGAVIFLIFSLITASNIASSASNLAKCAITSNISKNPTSITSPQFVT